MGKQSTNHYVLSCGAAKLASMVPWTDGVLGFVWVLVCVCVALINKFKYLLGCIELYKSKKATSNIYSMEYLFNGIFHGILMAGSGILFSTGFFLEIRWLGSGILF